MAERQREPGRDRGEKEEKTAEMRKKRRKVKEDRKLKIYMLGLTITVIVLKVGGSYVLF